MAGAIMGTAAYMTPEQARGHKVDKRADIWAFGVVVYEILTGRRLFDADNVSDVLAQVLTKELPLDAAAPRFRPLLRRCLERD
jgi:serine/threonine-protein kinase